MGRGVTSYHINTADCITAENTIRHRTVDGEVIEAQFPFLEDGMIWKKDENGEKSIKGLRVGVTSGASTPDKEVHDALGRIMMIHKVLQTENGDESPSEPKEDEENDD